MQCPAEDLLSFFESLPISMLAELRTALLEWVPNNTYAVESDLSQLGLEIAGFFPIAATVQGNGSHVQRSLSRPARTAGGCPTFRMHTQCLPSRQ